MDRRYPGDKHPLVPDHDAPQPPLNVSVGSEPARFKRPGEYSAKWRSLSTPQGTGEWAYAATMDAPRWGDTMRRRTPSAGVLQVQRHAWFCGCATAPRAVSPRAIPDIRTADTAAADSNLPDQPEVSSVSGHQRPRQDARTDAVGRTCWSRGTEALPDGQGSVWGIAPECMRRKP